MAEGEQTTGGLDPSTAIAETDSVVANVGVVTERTPIPVLRSRLNQGNQEISGDVEVSGAHKANSYEGNGALLVGVPSAGVGGSSSETSLSLIANSGGANPASKVAFLKEATLLGEMDENGLELKTGIPYTHEDESIPFDKDINQNGKELINSKTILDQQVKPYYHLRGADYITVPHDINGNLDVGTNDFSITGRFRTSTTTLDVLFVKGISPDVYIGYMLSNGKVVFQTVDAAVDGLITSDGQYNDGEWHSYAFLSERGGNNSMYIDGVLQSETAPSGTATLSNTEDFIYGKNNGASGYWEGDLGDFALYNHLLTPDKAKSIASSPLIGSDWIDKGGSNVAITGPTTVIVGKRYRTNLFVAGDDFSNIADTGASANVTGAEWIATGAAPTTWTNGSTLHQLGATAVYDGNDFTDDTAYDSSGNDNHGAVTGAELCNDTGQFRARKGTFTPTVTFSGGNGTLTYDWQVGEYHLDQGMATVSGSVRFDKGTASGDITLTDMPFTAKNTANLKVPVTLNMLKVAIGSGSLQGSITENTKIISPFTVSQTTGDVNSIPDTALSTTDVDIRFQITYPIEE